ncbi:MAG: hypothetical protein ACXAC5_09490 [Promethearchaeota archaeon]|jgi:hypothetical protein
MTSIWDTKADAVQKGDKLRDVSPLTKKTNVDENGFTHYIFSKLLFNNPWYTIPDDDLDLFKKFLEGGSRTYPSDGKIPCDIVAAEARRVLNHIVSCSEDSTNLYCDNAKLALKEGKNAMVRGTLKLYLGKYTSRDWRRKRFTDDIDFWCFQISVLDHALKECGWIKNKETGEFEKNVSWVNPDTGETKYEALCAANNLNQLLDFGSGSYLEGTKLKEIFNKKLKRGHDVDLSDIINVALYNDGLIGKNKDEWNDVWESFEAATNTRNSRITSNIISLCRYSLGIADHLERVNTAIDKYHDRIFHKKEYPDEALKRICRTSIHWIQYFEKNGADETRNMLHEFFLEQKDEKPRHVRNLRSFARNVLKLLNSKYEYLKIVFEFE